ncbi:hypothetical protein E1B28_010085 [Marasmius oreades]|uniref:Uncharacterized protein n=1 Tax=Marasmius oreades TaxID=181124 RepID=A0A9P7UTA7_9AGAR|nr:uncharacterized protein E1B28_010085 [Marasmius oreades]KAG7091024.1 hypothetical protein E1B28_010085 [Marasmius oreades]
MSTRRLNETESGSATPVPGRRHNHVAVQNLSNQLNQLCTTLRSSASAQQENIVQLGQGQADIGEDIKQLDTAVKRQRLKERDTLDNTKKWVREDLRSRILSRLQDDMQDHIKAEIAKTVKEQVDAQITNHIPIPLKEQLADCQAQVKCVTTSLTNSKARGIHAYYDLENSLQEPLKEFVNESGRKSDVYPADLNSLLTYDTENLKKLVRDYGLVVDNDRAVNINRFMDHIGIKHQVLKL